MRGIRRARGATALAVLLPGLIVSPTAVFAAPQQSDDSAAQPNIFDPARAPVIKIRVTASRRAPVARQQGSQTVLSAKAIENKPGVTSFEQVIASSVPGTATAQSGQIHVRGSHGQYSYYLDGAPLPSNVSGSFSDLINPKDIESLRVFTGGFPAEYGGQLAAIFDVTAKGGKVGGPGGFVQQLAQGYGTYQTTAQVGGSARDLSYFVSGIRSSTESQISPLTETPIHDGGNSAVAFGKFDYQSGPSDRISVDTAATGAHLQIPNTPDRQAVGQSDTQDESGSFANLIWKHARGADTTRWAFYSHASILKYNPSAGDLIPSAGQTVAGLQSASENQKVTYAGLRLDRSTPLSKSNSLQLGLDINTVTVNQNFRISGYDSNGAPMPAIVNAGAIHGGDRSAYIQDDLTAARTHINYGIRYDQHNADVTTSQWSPRINIDYTAGKRDTFRAYYDRLFQPAAIEDVQALSVPGQIIKPFQPERDDFFQGGWTHKLSGDTSFGVDAYYRAEQNTIDDAVIGNTQILVPINFSKGYARGVELTLEGQVSRQLSYYANYARSWAKAAGPITGGLFSGASTPGYIYDDHDQTHTAAFGLDYENKGVFWNIDGEYGSGLPYGDSNQLRVKSHVTLDAGIGTDVSARTQVAFTVNNVFNHAYVIKQSSPFSNTQWSLGRQFGIKLTQNF